MTDTIDNTKTAAERYREILASRRSTYKATSPSGMEWELRQVQVQDYFLANQLPFQVAQKVAEKVGGGMSEAEALASLPNSEQMEWLVFLQKLVRDAVVSPRIVEHAKAPDEIDFVLQEDFEFLAGLVMGGEAARAAATFRGGSGPRAVGGADGKKRRAKA